jgi:hypothetical protein
MRKRTTLFLFALLLLAAAFSQAQDKRDEDATKMILEYTTDTMFLTPLVDYLPASDTVPSPLQVLGYISGTPGKQTYYDDILRYYRTLDEKSDRVTMFDIGKSDQGNMMVVVVISDSATIADLDRYRGFTKELADPRVTSTERMEELVKQAKPFYLLSGSLHSPETGSPEMLMELAYRLAVSDTEMIKRIRDKVITLIVPVLETDGWNRQTDWYYRHTKKIEKYDEMPSRATPYWGDYTQHDNNRDGIMVSQRLTRSFFDAFFMFYPQICHDLHESVPLLYISTGTGPYYTSQDPVTINEWQWLAFNEVTQMTSYGVPGVWTHGFYDGWYPGYLLWLPNNHNAIGRFYETFGNAGANTYEREVSFRFGGGGGGGMSREWYRPLPPPEKVVWSLRNNVNLQESGCLIALDFTARNADTILKNFWKKGDNAINAGKNSAPYAWIIAPDQRDLLAANRLLDVMRRQRVEMNKLTADLTIGEGEKAKTYPAGSVVIRMDQPYRTIAKTLLENQDWPQADMNNPYDATAWTLGLMMGVKTAEIDDKAVLEAAMEPLGDGPAFTGRRDGMRQSQYTLVPPQDTAMINAFVALEKAGVEVKVSDSEFKIGEHTFPAGTWVLPGYHVDDVKAKAVSDILDRCQLNCYLPSQFTPPELRTIKMPRLAMYHSWYNTQESGWTRFALEQDNVPFKLINDERVRKGNLLADFDVIIIPHQGGWGGGTAVLRGIDKRFSPLPYNKTDQFKYMGYPDSSDDITGGIGLEGALALEKFVKEGGTLITLGSGSNLILDLGFVEGVNGMQQPRNVDCPGTLLNGTIRQPGNPILYGHEGHPALYREDGELIMTEDQMRKYVVLQFGSKEPSGRGGGFGPYAAAGGEGGAEAQKPDNRVPLLIGGLLRNGDMIDGSAAIVDAPLEKGRVVIFAFNPMYRWMNHDSFSYVYNALMNWQAPAALREAPEKKEEEKKEPGF